MDELVPEPPDPPLFDLPPEPDDVEPDDEPLPLTVSPSSALTEAIVPAMGERSTASSRFCRAVSAALAEETWAFAEAMAALLPSLSTTSE